MLEGVFSSVLNSFLADYVDNLSVLFYCQKNDATNLTDGPLLLLHSGTRSQLNVRLCI